MADDVVWFQVDDSFYDHPKFQSIPRRDRLATIGLWTAAGAYCAHYLTDGYIHTDQVRRLGGTPRLIAHLTDAKLWLPVENGYQFYEWNDWQRTRFEVEKDRAEARARMRELRASKKHKKP